MKLPVVSVRIVTESEYKRTLTSAPDTGLLAWSITETNKVLDFIKEIKRKGKSCIFITHNIYHVYPVADRFVIVDRGRVVADYLKNEISLDNLLKKLKHIAAHEKKT